MFNLHVYGSNAKCLLNVQSFNKKELESLGAKAEKLFTNFDHYQIR